MLETDLVCSSVNVGSTKTGINMDAVKLIGEMIKETASDLENFVTQKDISGTIGIAHTRWATHGEPCSANAHPHYSLSLIHIYTEIRPPLNPLPR